VHLLYPFILFFPPPDRASRGSQCRNSHRGNWAEDAKAEVAEEDRSSCTGVYRRLLLLVLDAAPPPYPLSSSSMASASIGYPLKSEEEPPEEVLAETQRRKALRLVKALFGFMPQG